MLTVQHVEVSPITRVGEVRAGDDLSAVILTALSDQDMSLRDGDILVVTQKIVSKAEGRLVELHQVKPSALANTWATLWNKDPRVVELVLQESRRIVRMERGVLICETRHGFVCANAGVDCSNVGQGMAALLPIDPDASADRLRAAIHTPVRAEADPARGTPRPPSARPPASSVQIGRRYRPPGRKSPSNGVRVLSA